jgi:hypothetical protein
MKITKNQLRRIIRESINESTEHPYDRAFRLAMNSGYYSDSDAVEEIENDLMTVDKSGLSQSSLEALEELEASIEGEYNDDAADLLYYIPKEIKDRLPVQEFETEVEYDY